MDTLRSLAKVPLAMAVGERCAEQLAMFESLVCFKLLVSKGLSFGILLGSTFVKMPQILKIVQAKSAKGLVSIADPSLSPAFCSKPVPLSLAWRIISG
jgi:hypothetical protein